MIDKLKQILEEGVKAALKGQAEHINSGYIMQGKGEAFKEVLAVIGELEKQDESVAVKEEAEVKK